MYANVSISIHYPVLSPLSLETGNLLSLFAYLGHFIPVELYNTWYFVTASFNLQNAFKIHPGCSVYRFLIPFYSQIFFHCVDIQWALEQHTD